MVSNPADTAADRINPFESNFGRRIFRSSVKAFWIGNEISHIEPYFYKSKAIISKTFIHNGWNYFCVACQKVNPVLYSLVKETDIVT